MGRHQSPAGEHEIGQSEQRVELSGVLSQPTISGFAMSEQILDDMKRMLDSSPNARLDLLDLLGNIAQFPHGLERFAFAAFHRNVPGHRPVSFLFALLDTLVARNKANAARG